MQVHRLTINGRSYETLIEDQDTLLSVIRYRLDLIGTKQGCDKGDCGACTVLINNEARLSCLELAKLVSENEEITTIEGMALGDEVDLLLHAFDQSGALQCGFCQPGMILSAKALLMRNHAPSLEEIRQALSGNLCRCTGYTRIYQAVQAAGMVLSNQVENLDQAFAHLSKE